MVYNPKVNYYPTNPVAAICAYYGVDWDSVWMLGWSVPYGETVSHVVDDADGKAVSISLYRMPSGSYEALAYRC